ncbi:hypothetical protein [Bilophila wadsworthia]|uniref:hypothetical protein n=1 Tax=Bilophila wadsworthia TaxID=35833 RepID=UPI00242D7000|nr:hypothetical protein [Bilophila wadsworthia]
MISSDEMEINRSPEKFSRSHSDEQDDLGHNQSFSAETPRNMPSSQGIGKTGQEPFIREK